MMVKFTYCTMDQIREMLRFHYPGHLVHVEDTHIVITPAQMMQLITIFDDVDRIVEILLEYKNFIDVDISSLTPEPALV